MTRLLARINARLDDIEAGPAVIAVAVFLAVSIVGLIFGGQTVLNVVLITAGVVLFWNGGLLHSRADEALDVGDANSRRLDALRDAPAELPDDADRWADDGGPEPVRGPDTVPAAAVLIDHAFDEAETGPIPVVPRVGEEWRARFTFREEAST